MTSITDLTIESTTTSTTREIILACIANRLSKDIKKNKIKDLINTYLKKDKDIGNAEWDPVKYSKYCEVLYSPERTYQRCDIKKYTDGKAFISYLERHPTYKSSRLHNNNVSWYQISEIITFTVDLLEECYEAGRIKLIPFLIDWFVSCINQQNCIHTGDGWADILTALPSTWNDSYILAPLNAQQGNSIALEKEVISKQEDSFSITPSGSSSKLPNVDSSQLLSVEPSLEKMSSDDEILKESTSFLSIDKKLLDSSTGNELILLRCSCGNEKNMKRIGNFVGACKEPGCERFTCSLCSSTFDNYKGAYNHITRHRLQMKSPVTKEHVKNNTQAYNAVCGNCKSSNSVRSFLMQFTKHANVTKYLGRCKLCKKETCMYPTCGVSGNYHALYMHIRHKHLGDVVPRKPKPPSESRELHLLKCGTCKSMSNMVRDGKFWSKCGTPSCKDYGIVFCLICGRQTLASRKENHLQYHGADSHSLITDEHVDSNMKLYNKTCENCKVQSCVHYSSPARQIIGKCKCCTHYVCMFPGCERYYYSLSSIHVHGNRH